MVKSSANDPREDFLARINFSDTRIRSFRGFLFLCGGPNDPNSYSTLLSARHLIYSELISGRYSDLFARLKVAEDIQDWFRGGKYEDLVTFEEHLASLSSVILLVVESPGSIAELGAFAVTGAISGRLIALIDERHFNADSFIKLGPINRLEADTGRRVLVHDWHESDHLGRLLPAYEKLRPDVAQILTDVRELLGEASKEQVFKTDDPGHAMILICELCDLFGALSQQEIEGYAQRFNPSFSQKKIDQFLFLLERCGILAVKPKGNGRYFYPVNWSTHITFSFTDGQRVDRDRVRVDVVDYYKQHIKTRAEVVRLLRKVS